MPSWSHYGDVPSLLLYGLVDDGARPLPKSHRVAPRFPAPYGAEARSGICACRQVTRHLSSAQVEASPSTERRTGNRRQGVWRNVSSCTFPWSNDSQISQYVPQEFTASLFELKSYTWRLEQGALVVILRPRGTGQAAQPCMLPMQAFRQPHWSPPFHQNPSHFQQECRHACNGVVIDVTEAAHGVWLTEEAGPPLQRSSAQPRHVLTTQTSPPPEARLPCGRGDVSPKRLSSALSLLLIIRSCLNSTQTLPRTNKPAAH